MKKLTSSLLVLACITACGKKREATTTLTDTLDTSLKLIEDGFTPASLTYSSSQVSANSGGPCGGLDLFACQPVLLRIYVSASKDMLKIARSLLTELGTELNEIPDGDSGTVETDDGMSIVYDKTSATDYSLLLKAGEDSVGYIDVADGVFTIKMDLSKLEPEDEDSPGSIEMVVNYTDEDTWGIDVKVLGMACTDEDPRAPRKIYIKNERDGSLWKGKAMLYNGVWAENLGSGGSPTCDSVESDDSSMALMTEFVGDDTAAKGNVFMMKRTVDTVGDIYDFPLSSFDETYGLSVSGVDFSDYANSFCNPAATNEATWDSNCTGVSATIAAAEFSSASDWITPAAFSSLTISLPEALGR